MQELLGEVFFFFLKDLHGDDLQQNVKEKMEKNA